MGRLTALIKKSLFIVGFLSNNFRSCRLVLQGEVLICEELYNSRFPTNARNRIAKSSAVNFRNNFSNLNWVSVLVQLDRRRFKTSRTISVIYLWSCVESSCLHQLNKQRMFTEWNHPRLVCTTHTSGRPLLLRLVWPLNFSKQPPRWCMRSKFVGGACTVSVRSRSLSCKDPSPATTTHAENSGIF